MIGMNSVHTTIDSRWLGFGYSPSSSMHFQYIELTVYAWVSLVSRLPDLFQRAPVTLKNWDRHGDEASLGIALTHYRVASSMHMHTMTTMIYGQWSRIRWSMIEHSMVDGQGFEGQKSLACPNINHYLLQCLSCLIWCRFSVLEIGWLKLHSLKWDFALHRMSEY